MVLFKKKFWKELIHLLSFYYLTLLYKLEPLGWTVVKAGHRVGQTWTKLNSLPRYDVAYITLENSSQSGSACVPTQPQNFTPSPHLKTVSYKIIIEIKLLDMPMLLFCTKLHLSKCRDSWVFSIDQNKDFNFQLPSAFVFFISHKNGLVKSCSS
jgi:hypothetical protein